MCSFSALGMPALLSGAYSLVFVAGASAVAVFGYQTQADARCPGGFDTPPGYNFCVPSSPSDRKIWFACSEESRRLGLPEISQFGEQRRLKIIDNYIEYCQRSKLPHLY